MPSEIDGLAAMAARLANKRQEVMAQVRAIDEKLSSVQDLIAYVKSGDVGTSVLDFEPLGSKKRKHGVLQAALQEAFDTFDPDEIMTPTEIASRLRQKRNWTDSNLYNCVFTALKRLAARGDLEWLPGKGFLKAKPKPQKATG